MISGFAALSNWMQASKQVYKAMQSQKRLHYWGPGKPPIYDYKLIREKAICESGWQNHYDRMKLMNTHPLDATQDNDQPEAYEDGPKWLIQRTINARLTGKNVVTRHLEGTNRVAHPLTNPHVRST